MTGRRLTPHQAEVLDRVMRRRHRLAEGRAIDASEIGSDGALNRLHVKGYLILAVYAYGPRGGARYSVTPTALAWDREASKSESTTERECPR